MRRDNDGLNLLDVVRYQYTFGGHSSPLVVLRLRQLCGIRKGGMPRGFEAETRSLLKSRYNLI